MNNEKIHQNPALNDRTGVFADRADAGEALVPLVAPLAGPDALVLAIPAGGVPVALPLAEGLAADLDVVPVSKITLPWNTEAGYGAVAWDGTVLLNRGLLPALGLDEAEIEEGIARTREKAKRRLRELRGEADFPGLAGRTVVVVDDGLASGFTLRTAIAALRRAGARRLVAAVPTGHRSAAEELAGEVEALCCANLRGGRSFAVADAYRHWRDVSEIEAARLLERWQEGPRA